ncbi:MAG: phage tail protein [Holophagales bacterium]|nr:phage tail protein [Holophagales bacterium]
MIDANGSRYHLLQGELDWRGPLAGADGLDWDAGTVALEARLPAVGGQGIGAGGAASGFRGFSASDRRGAAADRFGNLYWIADDRRGVELLPAGARRSASWFRLGQLFEAAEASGDFRPWDGGASGKGPGVAPLGDSGSGLHLSGLTVTGAGWLAAGMLDDSGTGGLLCFDLPAGGPPVWWRWPESSPVPFVPFDLAPLADGGLVVLDRDGDRLWRLDRHLSLAPWGGGDSEASLTLAPERRLDFAPYVLGDEGQNGGPGQPSIDPAQTLPAPLELGFASPPGGTALAVAPLPDGSILVLENAPEEAFSRLHRFAAGEARGSISLEGVLRPLAAGSERSARGSELRHSLRGHDLTFSPGTAAPTAEDPSRTVMGELSISDVAGIRAVAFELVADPESFRLTPLPGELPLEAHGGRALVRVPLGGIEGSPEACVCGPGSGPGALASSAAADHRGDGFPSRNAGPAWDVLYDSSPGGSGPFWLPVAELPRRRRHERGEVAGLIFDAREAGTAWHRLIFDGCVPPGCAVKVWSRWADTLPDLLTGRFRPEPEPVRRASGPELPYAAEAGGRYRGVGWGSYDLLFQSAEGRYLELRLELSGDGRRTPRIGALRVVYPRFSYLREYLPAVWSEDRESASLTERFLANLEGLWTALEGHIAHADLLFDPRTAPADWLDWLATWLGAVLDPTWGEDRRRLFLEHAVQLFRWRGTRRGLLAMLRLALDPCVDAAALDLEATPSPERSAGFGGIRLVEHFATRTLPAVSLGDPTRAAVEGPGLVRAADPWQPAQGAAALHARYTRFVGEHFPELLGPASPPESTSPPGSASRTSSRATALEFSPLPPESGEELLAWRAFVATELAFPYAEIRAAELPAWQRFLGRRFGRFPELASRWPAVAGLGSFARVPLPGSLPDDEVLLFEWMRFASVVVPTARRAHRFTVLIPAEPGERADVRLARLRRAERLLAAEKPTHTDFEVRLYWALFQAGTARLGIDTAVGEGSRFVAQSLGGDLPGVPLGEGYLGGPPVATGGRVLGHDPRSCDGLV